MATACGGVDGGSPTPALGAARLHAPSRSQSLAPPACEPGRWDVPEQLPGTGMISGYPELDGAETIVRLLRATPWLYRPLRDAVRALGDGKSGPDRMAGCWACAFFGWVDSPEADVQPWYGDTTDEFWRACGFSCATLLPDHTTGASSNSRTSPGCLPRRSTDWCSTCASGSRGSAMRSSWTRRWSSQTRGRIELRQPDRADRRTRQAAGAGLAADADHRRATTSAAP